MAHLDAAKDISFYAKLVEAFTICDGYHCSGHTSTSPNRGYFFTGTAKGYTANNFFNENATRAGWKTYAEHLQDLQVDWKFYQNGLYPPSSDPTPFVGEFGGNHIYKYKQFQDRTTDIGRRCTDTRTVLRTDPDVPSQFELDVAEGKLPAVSWISAPAAFSDHPDGISPHFGEYYTNEILKVLAAHPDMWRKTVFIQTYDENDGFFDHVPPPLPPLPALKDVGKVSAGIVIHQAGDPKSVDTECVVLPTLQPTKTMGLGNRVPCLIISPWTVGGRVCSELFDQHLCPAVSRCQAGRQRPAAGGDDFRKHLLLAPGHLR